MNDNKVSPLDIGDSDCKKSQLCPCLTMVHNRYFSGIYMRNLILLIKRYLFLLYPLPEFVVIHKDASILKNVQSLEDFVREGLNVRKVTLSQDRELYGIEMHTEPNYPTLGKKAGVKTVTEKICGMSDTDIEKLLSNVENESPLTIIDVLLAQTSEIARVATNQREDIEAILKKPFALSSNITNKENTNVVIKEKLSVKDGEIEFIINRTI